MKSIEPSDLNLIHKACLSSKIGSPKTISRFASGQINRVYDIDNKFVIKLQGEGMTATDNLFIHQFPAMNALAKLKVKVPKILECGTLNETNYLLMKKIKGENLAKDWLSFSDKKKETLMAQIAEQLRLIHSIKYKQYVLSTYEKTYFASFKEAIMGDTRFDRIETNTLDPSLAEAVAIGKDFYDKNLFLLDNIEEPVFVHNDIHFENIFYQGDKITGIIDFDFSCQAPANYELWMFISFLHNPIYYVQKTLEKDYASYNTKKEIIWLRKYYPALFADKNVCDLIRLYSLGNILEIIEEYQSGRWKTAPIDKIRRKIEDYFKSNWLEEFIFGA